MSAFQVYTTMEDGVSYEPVVIARTAADACIVVGTQIRAASEVDVLDGVAGIEAQSARKLPDGYILLASNFRYRPDS